MATFRMLFSQLRRSNPHSTLLVARVSHFPSLPRSPSHRCHPLSSSVSRSFFSSAGNIEEQIFPVRVIVLFLDGYHDFSGFPWWITIASSTVAMRFALLPSAIIQVQKLKMIYRLGPKLPSPFPTPMSGRSYIEQILHFQKERKAIGCPSYLWCLAPFSIQVPVLLLWMESIRRMSLDNYHGFESGGALWFQNLTELPHGVFGPISPFLIASLYYIIVQVSFGTSSAQKVDPLLAKHYKLCFDFWIMTSFGISFLFPQGSLVYWVTNLSFNLIQNLTLKHPAVREMLGSQDKNAVSAVESLSPKELLALSLEHLSRDEKDLAISMLKLALDKDPEYVKAMVVMGMTLAQKVLLVEATEYFERAISKLMLSGHPTELEDIHYLIISSLWAGVAYMKQGKKAEGLVHLERIATLKEPEDPKSKAYYFEGLLVLSSGLLDSGRKAESLKFLRLVVGYNPKYSHLLEEVENEKDDIS